MFHRALPDFRGGVHVPSFVGTRRVVRIDKRGLEVAVTHPFLKRSHGHTLRCHLCAEGVSEVVNAGGPEPHRLQGALEPLEQRRGVERRSPTRVTETRSSSPWYNDRWKCVSSSRARRVASGTARLERFDFGVVHSPRNDGLARQTLGSEQLHAPHLLDAEVTNGLRRRVATGLLGAEQGLAALRTLGQLAITRYPIVSMLERIWEVPREPLGVRRELRRARRSPRLPAAHRGRSPRTDAGLRCTLLLVPAVAAPRRQRIESRVMSSPVIGFQLTPRSRAEYGTI